MNFHKSPFDEGTTTKLELFAAYAKEWLPVFLSGKNRGAVVTVADFFAGPGRDLQGREGSPLLLLRRIREYTKLIRQNDVRVRLELNEGAKRKSEALTRVMEEQKIPPSLCRWHVHNLSFEVAFDALYPGLNAGPNLILLDQQGMKFISDSVFQKIIALEKTDFLFFIASSFIRRFWDHEYFKKHLPIPGAKITGGAFSEIHRAVTDYYRGLVPPDKQLFLPPFSIKKGKNIYGVIFGSANTPPESKVPESRHTNPIETRWQR